MFIFAFITYVLIAIAVAALVYSIGYSIALLLRKIFNKKDVKIMIAAIAIFILLACVALSPMASRAELTNAEELEYGRVYRIETVL